MLKEKIQKIRECVYQLPKGIVKGMNVPALVFLNEKMIEKLEKGALEQIANVATLPGIQKHAIGLPDMHFGYGFPIGGVAALDIKEGGLSPGGVGFDINCGVRLLRTNLTVDEIRPKINQLVEEIFRNVPCGVGRVGKIRLSNSELREVLETGVKWAIKNGYGNEKDRKHLEEEGCMKEADANVISDKAMKRGAPQLGSLGAGNHFLEIQRVAEIYELEIAKIFGIEKINQICLMIHTGSRGFGHQVCTDYVQLLETKFPDVVKKLPDRELVYAPAGTKECDDYFKAMSCAANFAWTNRQMIMHWVRQSFIKVLGMKEQDIGLEVVYDITHNTAKKEKHKIDGKIRKVYMHRKGGTRCFGPEHEEIPSDYRKVGQPALIPGDMGSASYIMLGTKKAEEETFSSIAHGAGRVMSRHAALKQFRGEQVKNRLAARGILVKAPGWKAIAEESPGVYKNIHEVIDVCERAGIGKTIVRLEPIGVVKG